MKQLYNNKGKHSPEINEIIEAQPGWLVSWGIGVFVVLIISIVLLSTFIRYPEIITGKLIIEKNDHNDNRSWDVNQNNTKTPYGRLFIPQNLFAKIKLKQRVLIDLDRYPAEQYGVLSGDIDSLSVSPDSDGLYEARLIINVADNRKIHLNSGLTGNARVITNNTSLLEKLLSKKSYH